MESWRRKTTAISIPMKRAVNENISAIGMPMFVQVSFARSKNTMSPLSIKDINQLKMKLTEI
jgi:hypothetical protein